jgi:Fe-S cluster assembly protein SufD
MRDRPEPGPLSALRRAALDRFEALGFPSSRRESWRFTDVSALGQVQFTRAKDAPVDPAALPRLDGHRHRLVFVNGHFVPGLSHLEGAPDKALLVSLRQALLTHPDLVLAYLERLRGLEDHPFAALNSAFLEDGAFVYLPRGAVLTTPLHLVFVSSGAQTVSYPRNLIVAEEASQLSVVEDYCGNGRYLTCPVTEAYLGDGAVLEYHKIQQEDAAAWHLGGLRVRQGRDSQARLHMVSSGGLLNRTDVFALLDGEGADCNINGLTVVEDEQLGDYHLRVEHAKPQGTSRQLFKGILDDKSRAVFDSLIYVHPHAQKTDASQTNRNLLLSRRAVASSNPRLEILADDVKCSHGSTIGFLDPDALFYLRSRGIGEAEARAMLVYAFANDSVERIRLKPLRERLEHLLFERLYPAVLERKSA